MAVFTVTFTIGLYVGFKEPFNSISIFSIVLALPLWFVVYLENKRLKNIEESKKRRELENENENENQSKEQSKDSEKESDTALEQNEDKK